MSVVELAAGTHERRLVGHPAQHGGEFQVQRADDGDPAHRIRACQRYLLSQALAQRVQDLPVVDPRNMLVDFRIGTGQASS